MLADLFFIAANVVDLPTPCGPSTAKKVFLLFMMLIELIFLFRFIDY